MFICSFKRPDGCHSYGDSPALGINGSPRSLVEDLDFNLLQIGIHLPAFRKYPNRPYIAIGEVHLLAGLALFIGIVDTRVYRENQRFIF